MAKTSQKRLAKRVDQDPSSGVIRADEVYLLPALLRRLGICLKTWQTMLEVNPPLRKIVRRVHSSQSRFVIGAELIEAMRNCRRDSDCK